MKKNTFDTQDYLDKVDAWFRAANYLSVGQMYLRNNPLLRSKITSDDVKVYPIGHWGTIPGQNFAYAHLNRVINKYNLNMFYIEGPGHGGQVMTSNSYLDGSYTELFPHVTQDVAGMKHLFKYFSFPGGTASHAAPETPGSIHEGGELGYSLSHATGAILDNPNVIAATIVGDGEAETGPLAASWFSNSFINPVNDGAVLPILHLNGGKISNPTILCRKSNKELTDYFAGMGWEAVFVEGSDEKEMHKVMAQKLDYVIEKIQSIQNEARKKPANQATRPIWPMMVLRTPKGWTGPDSWNKDKIVGSFRAHQVPIPVNSANMEHIDALLDWLKSYKVDNLFDKNGKLVDEIAQIAPKGDQRMGMNPITNGGLNPKKLVMPRWQDFALKFSKPGELVNQDMVELGTYFAKMMELNKDNFRLFGPDETKSNRLYNVFKVTKRQWLEPISPILDEALSPEGRVIDSQLSEHQAEGFLEGYVLTGRHGVFASYESFLRVVDSMLTQHLKWLKKAKDVHWRNDYPSLNVIATSTAFQQDHNGYTHQDPGLIGHLADKTPEIIRQYLPADTNTLLAVMDKSLKERNVINHIIASKQPREQFYSEQEAAELVEKGLKVIDWASTTKGNEEPELVVVAAGTEPNLEALAAVTILNKEYPSLKIRFVNVVDLMKLRHPSLDPRGLSDKEFDAIFTSNKPIVFAFHGYEGILRDMFFKRNNHNLITHGYRENGDITTSFDIRQLSHMDRFHISASAAKAVYGNKAQEFEDKMIQTIDFHTKYIREYGTDIPEVKEWKWADLTRK
ncbi:phosphoketolase family protein [Mycoplasmopsis alligatoris]|uniref:D-xylulose 5-phosphate/D-fructose 6-phosphate phosphoketolase n=1 Tax=Mycoplasmopsis alligatoris A21JP2 TaxID=747682 RepID=D4XW60_9BACT|nr:phosphoketolase family protein [Mycoplasmopsis alligatoris]EFF41422.1 D-xylulose 5-phosphate/D-fructose 6-phosphate phosphoketolase [Mycoplasmopsis alligatoris A21JP2]